MTNRAPSRSTPRRSATEMLEQIDWDALSTDAREAIQTIGPLLAEDYSRSEIAAIMETPVAVVTARIRLIESEIRAQVHGGTASSAAGAIT